MQAVRGGGQQQWDGRVAANAGADGSNAMGVLQSAKLTCTHAPASLRACQALPSSALRSRAAKRQKERWEVTAGAHRL